MACSAGHVSAGFGLFQLILSHITLFNQPKSAEILPAELDHRVFPLCRKDRHSDVRNLSTKDRCFVDKDVRPVGPTTAICLLHTFSHLMRLFFLSKTPEHTY
jgi:hypothetical protein